MHSEHLAELSQCSASQEPAGVMRVLRRHARAALLHPISESNPLDASGMCTQKGSQDVAAATHGDPRPPPLYDAAQHGSFPKGTHASLHQPISTYCLWCTASLCAALVSQLQACPLSSLSSRPHVVMLVQPLWASLAALATAAAVGHFGLTLGSWQCLL